MATASKPVKLTPVAKLMRSDDCTVTTAATRIGVVADTHGLLRPEVTAAFRSCSAIIHAGDIGRPDLVAELEQIAPTWAVRGNNDKGPWAEQFPASHLFQIQDVWIYLLHDSDELDIDPLGAGVHIIVSGHSHRPGIVWRDDVLFLNPGSAGPRRFKLPVTVAELTIDTNRIDARLIDLSAASVPTVVE